MTQRLLPYGDLAWLVECDTDPIAVAAALRRFPWQQAPEIVVGARTCLLRFHRAPVDEASLVRAVSEAVAEPAGPEDSGDVLRLPVRYDGDDLGVVAQAAEVTVEELIALHSSAVYRVAFLGFAPGFGYLEGLPAALHLPRRQVPRTSVPAGAVAIADRYTAVYPRASPGGWHLIGTCPAAMFDPERSPASLLRPGMAVRFQRS